MEEQPHAPVYLEGHQLESSLAKEDLRVSLIKVYIHLKGGYKEDEARLFLVVPSVRGRGNGHKQ